MIVDVFDDFSHEDGDALLASFESRFDNLRSLLQGARTRGIPVVFANDTAGIYDGDAGRVVEAARSGPAGERIDELAPVEGDRFVIKPRYSAFDSTPLALILRDLKIERVVVAGMTTEGCVAQTAIDAREEGLKVTVVPAACATIDTDVEAIALAYLERVVGVRLEDASAVTGGGPTAAR